ncbi:MAG: universal stress protein [Lentisphaerae bacterium]|nr:universal stress protein [Lentisphaerota bacterium]
MEIRIDRILCPVDFSMNSEHALLYATAFATSHGAELLLLHVVPPPVYEGMDVGGFYELPAEAVQELADACNRRLEQVAESARKRHPKVAAKLVSGNPFLEIVKTAREEKADLIVMGTHGRTGMAHVLMGSVAERVVRKAPCPVLTVKHPEHEFVMP